jgi:ankyrin repeat protein
LDVEDNEGVTPLCMAAEQDGGHEVVQFLLERGANAHSVDKKGRTMLHAAASGGGRTIEYFQKYNLDVNAVDSRGVKPLHCAAEVSNNFSRAAKWLREHGADISAIDEQGRTVLHYAVLSQSPHTVNFLLEDYLTCMDLDATDNDGATPLHYAVAVAPPKLLRKNCKQLLEVLLSHGASVNVSNKLGESPFDVARSLGYKPYVNLLMKHVQAQAEESLVSGAGGAV